MYDRRFLSKLLIALEKAVTKNSEMRFRYKSEPAKFYDTEKALYDNIRALSIISETDLYPEFEKMTDSIETLVGLITHENLMIGTQVIQIFEEIFDPANSTSTPQDMSNLAEALIDAGMASQLSLFLSMLEKESVEQLKSVNRGEMKIEDVFEGFQNVLNLVASVMTNDYKTGLRLVRKMDLINWITDRFTRDIPENEDQADTNENHNDDLNFPPKHTKYALAEFFAELFITVPESIKMVTKDLVDMLLLEIEVLRKKLPEDFFGPKSKGNRNNDFLRDVYDALISCLRFAWVNKYFLELEGTKLTMLLLNQFAKKEYTENTNVDKKVEWIRRKSLQLIVESSRGFNGTAKDSSEEVVAAGGIKTLFSLLKKNKKKNIKWEIITIFSNMLEWLEIGSDSRSRLCSKFGEASCAPLSIISESYKVVSAKLKYNQEIEAERLKTLAEFNITEEQLALMEKDEQEEKQEREQRKLQSQKNTLSVVLAWLCLEYEELRRFIVDKERISVKEIKLGLLEYFEEIKDANDDFVESSEQSRKKHDDDGLGRREKVEVLIKNNDIITCEMLETLADQLF